MYILFSIHSKTFLPDISFSKCIMDLVGALGIGSQFLIFVVVFIIIKKKRDNSRRYWFHYYLFAVTRLEITVKNRHFYRVLILGIFRTWTFGYLRTIYRHLKVCSRIN